MRVLVTRPEPGASETAARLKTLGHEAIVLPLTEIRQIEVDALPNTDAVDAVAVTSGNAVRHAPGKLMIALSGKPCFAVGARTAAACREAGFGDVRSAHGDAAALADLIAAECPQSGRIAYLCGRIRRPDFDARLVKQGFRILAIETYDTVRKEYPAEAIEEVLGGRPADTILLYSATAAEALASITRRAGIAPRLAAANYLCLSSRVAQALDPAAASRAMIAQEPTEAALISLIGIRSGRQDAFPDAPV